MNPWLAFLVGFVSAFAVPFLLMLAWFFLITRRRPKSREQIDAEFRQIRQSVLNSINSELN